MTVQEFFEKADHEGVGRFLEQRASRTDLEAIEDPELRRLAIKAQDALDDLENYREDHGIEYF
jgi:hypothetical protein